MPEVNTCFKEQLSKETMGFDPQPGNLAARLAGLRACLREVFLLQAAALEVEALTVEIVQRV
eukprot:scaffold317007_cov17-Tisochrysis_lutea.AAC.1